MHARRALARMRARAHHLHLIGEKAVDAVAT